MRVPALAGTYLFGGIMLAFFEVVYRFCTVVFTDWFLLSPMSVLFYVMLFYAVFILFLRLVRCI